MDWQRRYMHAFEYHYAQHKEKREKRYTIPNRWRKIVVRNCSILWENIETDRLLCTQFYFFTRSKLGCEEKDNNNSESQQMNAAAHIERSCCCIWCRRTGDHFFLKTHYYVWFCSSAYWVTSVTHVHGSDWLPLRSSIKWNVCMLWWASRLAILDVCNMQYPKQIKEYHMCVHCICPEKRITIKSRHMILN